jgi:pyrimidine-specific ribonucleoside hydrolase
METSDPDDLVTLCWLTSHPYVILRSVTITPGTREQIGIVRRVLELTDRKDVPIGSRKPDHPKQCVSPFHYQLLGEVAPCEPDDLGHEILAQVIRQYPDTTVVTGAPLSNLHALLENHPTITIHRWVAQGGFAGDSVVLPEHRLAKFAGSETCATYNFNSDPKAALFLLGSPRIVKRDLVSKNVCHGVVYDKALHQRLAPVKDKTPGLHLIYHGMELYLAKNPEGKMLHDPLAACVAIDRDICIFREVEMYRIKGEWGARLREGTSTYIAVAVDKERFVRRFLG